MWGGRLGGSWSWSAGALSLFNKINSRWRRPFRASRAFRWGEGGDTSRVCAHGVRAGVRVCVGCRVSLCSRRRETGGASSGREGENGCKGEELILIPPSSRPHCLRALFHARAIHLCTRPSHPASVAGTLIPPYPLPLLCPRKPRKPQKPRLRTQFPRPPTRPPLQPWPPRGRSSKTWRASAGGWSRSCVSWRSRQGRGRWEREERGREMLACGGPPLSTCGRPSHHFFFPFSPHRSTTWRPGTSPPPTRRVTP